LDYDDHVDANLDGDAYGHRNPQVHVYLDFHADGYFYADGDGDAHLDRDGDLHDDS
jgi:hypothetical protein